MTSQLTLTTKNIFEKLFAGNNNSKKKYAQVVWWQQETSRERMRLKH